MGAALVQISPAVAVEGRSLEAVLPVEVEIPSLRVLMEAELQEAEWVQARSVKLHFLKKVDGTLSRTTLSEKVDEGF